MINGLNQVKKLDFSISGLFALPAVIAWVLGAVLAHGFWSTLFAIIMPLWAWYLTAEWWLINYAGGLK
jgi:hypothetical protein